jgi:predicted nucleotidyltransferase
MGLDESVVGEIVGRILSVAKPDRIILFGSAATGQMTRDSDIDLLIVEPAPGDTRAEGLRIQDSLGGLGYMFDVFVIATERFEESRDVFGGLAYPAQKYGRTLYEAA